MLAVWMIGNVNWRLYWMKAVTSPSDIWPVATWMPPITAISDVVQVRDEHHRRLDDPGHELGPVAGLVEPLVLLVELGDRLLLAAERLDDRVAGVHLLDVAVERAGRCPLGDEQLLRPADDEDGHDERDRDREDRDQGEQRADRQHHDQHADDRQQRRDQLGQALLERLADVVDVVRDPAEDVAAGVRVEVAERQPAQLAIDLFAQAEDAPLGDAGHDVALDPAEERAAGRSTPTSVMQDRRRASLMSIRWHIRCDGRCALEDQVDRVPEDLRAEDREGHADDGEGEDEDDRAAPPAGGGRGAAGTSPGSPWPWPGAGPCPCPSCRPAGRRRAARRREPRRPEPRRREPRRREPRRRVGRSCHGLLLRTAASTRSRGRSRWSASSSRCVPMPTSAAARP